MRIKARAGGERRRCAGADRLEPADGCSAKPMTRGRPARMLALATALLLVNSCARTGYGPWPEGRGGEAEPSSDVVADGMGGEGGSRGEDNKGDANGDEDTITGDDLRGDTIADPDNGGGDSIGGGDGGDDDPGLTCEPGSMVLAIGDDLDDGEIEIGYDVELFQSAETGFPGTLFAGHSVTVYGGPVWAYFRFKLTVPLPASAVITSATLQIWGLRTFGWDAASEALYVRAEACADAAQITTRDDAPELASGRVLSAAVRWPTAGGLDWVFPGWNVSPDLSGLIQDRLSTHNGLAVDSHLQLWLSGAFEFDGEVGIEDFSSPDNHHTELTIMWVCP